MEKSIVRSLPPLVQGKLAGVFEFAIEEIKITEKVLKNDNFNLLIKVLWWGETKPLFLRPNKIHFITSNNNEVIINEPGENSVKYEVHTNLKLFKSYLEKCEVVELVVLNSLQNEVIGSIFLHNLIHLVFYTRFFNSPVINHSGDSIGEIYCQLSFKETNTKKCHEQAETTTIVSPVKKWSDTNLNINLNTLNIHSSSRDIVRESEINTEKNSNRIFHEYSPSNKNVPNDLHSQRSANLHYNSPVTQNIELEVDSNLLDTSDYSDKKNELINDHLKKFSSTNIDSKEVVELNLPMDSERSVKSSFIDSSKDVCKANFVAEPPKRLQVNVKDKKKIMNKSQSNQLINKKQEESIKKTRNCNMTHSAKNINKKPVTSKVKSYIENKAPKHTNICTKKTFVGNKNNQKSIMSYNNVTGNQKLGKITNGAMKSTGNIKSFIKVSKEISKLNKLYLNPSKDDHSDLEKVPVKENAPDGNIQDRNPLEKINKKEKDNQKNINVNESCKNYMSSKTNTKDYKAEKFDQNNEQSNFSLNLKTANVESKMRFDLNDPIEKIYYETFFLNAQNVCNNEFEIAELLNQPENKYILKVSQRRIFGKNEQQLGNHLFPEGGDFNGQNTHIISDKDDIRKGDEAKEEKLTVPIKIIQDKGDYIDNELIMPLAEAPQDSNLKSTSQREYKIDCHRCKYYKKLSELDSIIESLRIFETRLKNEVVLSSLSANANSKNFTDDCPLLPISNPLVQSVKDNKCSGIEHSDEELALGLDIDGSEFSKEDSDFIEFTHYLYNR